MYSQNESQNFSIVDTTILKAKLKPTTKLVYTAIASHYRGEGSLIYPSYNRIASLLGVSRNTAITAVKELVEAGILRKSAQMRADGGFTSNVYTLHPSNLNSLGGNLYDTSPSNLYDTSPSNLNTPRIKTANNKNNLFKINNIRARGAQNETGEMLRTLEQTDIEDFVITGKDREILEYASTSKSMSWFELVRVHQTYYIRPRSSKVFSFVTDSELEDLCELIAQSAGGCQALKYGQRYDMEVVINV